MTLQTYSFNKVGIIAAFLVGSAMLSVTAVKAQVNPFGSQYYQNQYLFNPAMAGLDAGLNVNLSYSKQSLGVDGAQNMQALSLEYQAKKVGLGLSVYNNISGVFRTTRAVVTYAYHIDLGGNNQKLSFGLSGGFVNQHLEMSNVIGTQNDPTLAHYNDSPTYFDGDFGVAYTNNNLTIQGALPDLKSLSNANSTAERELFFTSASYKIGNSADISVEPKVVFRQVRGFDKIIDAGANLAFSQGAFNLQAMYHSSKSATFGFGLHKTQYSILAFYTTNTSSLNAYNNGDVEVSLRFNLLKSK
ncbi:PorP/SprF family type IX secretion system membrane protein [Mucilaginibacter sp. HMF5004]|uniref:PorP/SprF family type IX secretion system membrane protein n=1 Tax=Mucilaginibacter rivuli TaxID=2857527 RepID=UPI001C5F78C5|nr:PorP/SprF family type IX secretion system membrane protein [Mucilaginibacter rivuli]MBW4890626.1 PorP/SprF family type IX secretion system membrane protein [Mucilaginibacter rivuli]